MFYALRSFSTLRQKACIPQCRIIPRLFVPIRTLKTSTHMRLQKDSGQNNDNFAETKDKQGAEADQPDKSNGYSEPDSLDDVFKMLDLPSFDPKDGVSSRIMENKQQVDGNKLNGNQDDIDMQGLFKELDRNNDFSDSSRSNIKRSISFNDGNEQSKADPMDEFEKILKDLADEDTEVFRSDNPAPFFWDKAASKSLSTKGKGSKDDYLDNLNPDTLFEDGPRASAFSAEKLAGDPNRISKIAARIVEDAKLTKHINEQQEQQARQSKAVFKKEEKSFKEREHNQLGKLSQCRSVSALSSFVYEELLPKTNDVKSGFAARPSPTVFADTIRASRELRVPQIAFFIYNFCRTRMDLIDKLQILDSDVYEELLATTWNGLRDISGVFFILQDAIAMGVVGSPQLERQIDQIVVELRKIYNMDDFANQVSMLKDKILPKRSVHEDMLAQSKDNTSPVHLGSLKRFNLDKKQM